MRLLNTGLAARPATMPITPAEASRLAPTWRAPGKVMSIIAPPATMHHRHGGAREHAGLREHAARLQVVGHVGGVLGEHAVGKTADGTHDEPGGRGDEQEAVQVPHAGDEAQVVGRGLEHQQQRHQRQHQPRGRLAVDDHRMHGGRRARDAPEDKAADAVDQKSKRNGDEDGKPGAEPGVGKDLLGHQAVVVAVSVVSFRG
jgi:hypothetical protein